MIPAPDAVMVPRELLLAVRAEVRAWSGHWAQGFTAAGELLTQHDKRMADGSCATCALLDTLNAYLHHQEPGPAAVVVDMASRRGGPPPPVGAELGGRTVVHVNPPPVDGAGSAAATAALNAALNAERARRQRW